MSVDDTAPKRPKNDLLLRVSRALCCR
ncbi:uncharacterized protein FPRO_14770 [Fusarium proliferatum ET1]|uniref:Uncharacterized protein n=1 Tax=Fusarium proliferatum (strain ET1) TaxID=1227346 RepID=A0A1L7WB00_FUSPR|nr:uncharacterized protein FPRO_14770 [Fusarium proliferatum ET1]